MGQKDGRGPLLARKRTVEVLLVKTKEKALVLRNSWRSRFKEKPYYVSKSLGLNTHYSMSSDEQDSSFFANILDPGSSLHPTFLLVVDCTFMFLLLVFITLAIITSGNIHVLALMAIEVCLWGSVKWYVSNNFKWKMELCTN